MVKRTRYNAFDGVDYQPDLDFERLETQYRKVWKVMRDGRWHTLRYISGLTGAPEASVSALLRDFRKEKNGSHIVNRRRQGDPKKGLFEYQLVINEASN